MIITFSIIGLLCVLGGLFAWFTRDTHLVRIKKGQVMEFKTSFELTGLPIIIFYQGKKRYNFLFDSGSNVSYIDSNTDIQVSTMIGTDSFTSASGMGEQCSVHNVKLYHNDKEFVCPIRKTNLRPAFDDMKQSYGITLSGIIGCDFMHKYSYCIDFKEMVIYVRK